MIDIEDKPLTESPVIRTIKTDLENWLNIDAWSFDELRRLIKGYSLPALGYDEEPYIWIMRSLHLSNFVYSQKLAKRIAKFIVEEKPYTRRNRSDSDKLFYNLFYLSAELNCKAELGKPLSEVLDYFQSNKSARNQFFSDEKSYYLKGAFKEALISNQTSNSFLSVWKEILKQTPDFFLQGNIFDGSRAILFMPDAENPNKPAVDEIGWALKMTANYLEPGKNRHERFRDLIVQIKEVWSDYPNWSETMIRQAIKNDLHDWAIVRLDNLVLPIGRTTAGNWQEYFVWEIYVPFLEELKKELGLGFEQISKNGVIRKIRASREVALFLAKVSPTVEKIRINSPFRSYKSMIGIANQGFMELESHFTSIKEIKLALLLDAVRKRILVELGYRTIAEIKEDTRNFNLENNFDEYPADEIELAIALESSIDLEEDLGQNLAVLLDKESVDYSDNYEFAKDEFIPSLNNFTPDPDFFLNSLQIMQIPVEPPQIYTL